MDKNVDVHLHMGNSFNSYLFYLFIYDFLGCGCGSCFVLFCLIGRDFHFLINWVVDFFFFGCLLLFLFCFN